MKKINFHVIQWVLLFVCLPLFNACNWEDLPAYEDAEITGVQFYYYWPSETQKDPITGEPVVKGIQLHTSCEVNSEAGTINASVSMPELQGDFTADVLAKVSTNPLWGQVTVSTAARITPIEGSAALGSQDDWSKERKFSVQAASGAVKIWTIKIVEFNK